MSLNNENNWKIVSDYSSYTTLNIGFGALEAGYVLTAEPDSSKQANICDAIKQAWIHCSNQNDIKGKRSFLKGCQRISAAHAGNQSYNVLSEGMRSVVQFVVNDANRQLLLSIKGDSEGFLTVKNGRLKQTSLPQDIEEQGIIADAILNVVYSLKTGSLAQISLIEHVLTNVCLWAKNRNLSLIEKILTNKLNEILLAHREVLECKTQFLEAKQSLQEEGLLTQLAHFEEADANLNAILEKCDQNADSPHFASQWKALKEEIATFQAQKITEIRKGLSAYKVARPLESLENELKVILDYKSTYYYLYADKGTLTLTYKSLSSADEIGAIVEQMADKLVNAFENQIETRENLYKVLCKFLTGLETIKSDYQKKYADIAGKIAEIHQNLLERVQKQHPVAEEVAQATLNNPEATPFDLIQLSLNEYAVDKVKSAFTRQYGERLTQHVIQFYLPENTATITYFQLRTLIIAAASDVIEADLTDKTAEELAKFRRCPNGKSWLEYFNIPLTQDKGTITNEYKTLNPCTTIEHHRARISLEVLADLESVELWRDPFRVRMDKNTLLEKFNRFKWDPTETQLFNDDYYLHFLEVAALVLAANEQAKTDQQIATTVLPGLQLLLRITCKTCKEDQMKPFWNELQQLASNPAADLTAYYKKLIVHPYQAQTGLSPEEIVRLLQSSEYLARKVGYLNKYMLENRALLDANLCIDDPKLKKIREGTVFKLYDNNEPVLYTVKKAVILNEGCVFQVCVPLDPRPYSTSKIPVKLLFMGTVVHTTTVLRDKEVQGPGNTLWREKGYGLMQKDLEEVITELNAQFPGVLLDLEIAGHSLGGADSQNASVRIAQQLSIEQDTPLNSVDKLRLVTFNTAGTTHADAKIFEDYMNDHPEKLDGVFHSLVKYDLVGESGQTKVGKNLKDPSKLHLVEARNHCPSGVIGNIMMKHCDLVYATGEKITMVRRIDPQASKVNKEIYDGYFAGVGHSFLNTAGRVMEMHTVSSSLTSFGFGFVQAVGSTLLKSQSCDMAELREKRKKLTDGTQTPEAKRKIEAIDKRISEIEKMTPTEKLVEAGKRAAMKAGRKALKEKSQANITSGMRRVKEGDLQIIAADH